MTATMRSLFVAILLCCAATAGAATLKIATLAPEGSGWMREMRAGAAAIKERSAGRVELKFYPAGVMGNDAAVIRKIKLGQLQGGAFSGAEASLIYKDAPIYSVPFLFRTQAEVDHVRGKVDALLRKGFEEHGMIAAGFSGGGFAYLMSTHPVHTREDLRKSKVWLLQSDHLAEVAYRQGGVSPISLPLTDVYPGLETGLIDTVANTPSGAIFFQWHTKVRHMVDLPLSYVVGILVIDTRAMDRIVAEDRTVVLEEIDRAFGRIDANARRENEDARATLARQGVTIFKPSEEEAGFWREIGDATLKRLIEEHEFTPAVLDAVRASLAQYRATEGKAAAP